MKLRVKIFSGFFVIFCLFFLGLYFNIVNYNKLQSQSKNNQRENQPILSLENIKNASLMILYNSASYVNREMNSLNPSLSKIYQKTSVEIDIENQRTKISNSWIKYQKESGIENKKKFQEIHESQKDFDQEIAEFIRILQHNNSDPFLKAKEIFEQNQKLSKKGEKLIAVIEEAIATETEQLNQAASLSESSQKLVLQSLYFNIIFILILAIVTTLLCIGLAEHIAKPIAQLKNSALKIVAGEWEIKPIETRKNLDELGILYQSLNRISEILKTATLSKSYVEKVIKNLKDALIVLNPDITIKDFNLATVLLLGFEESDLLGKPIGEFLLTPEYILDFLKIEDSISNSFMGSKETTLIAKDGRQIPVSLSASIMRDAQDNIEGIVCLAQDISARKQALEALRRQALMFETIYDGVIITDLECRIIDCNSAAERIFGYSKTEMLGKTPGMLRYPPNFFGRGGSEAVYMTQQIIDGVMRKGRWSGEFRFIRADGTSGICETVVVPLRDDKNKMVATIGVNRDITERKLAEEALRESEERLESILKSLNDIVWSMAVDTREMLYLNPAIEKVYGRSVSEFFENHDLWFQTIHPEDRERVMESWEQMFTTREKDLEYRILRPDGEVRWLHDRGKLIQNGHGKPLRFEGIATDITERKRAEEALQQAHAELEKRVEERTAELTDTNYLLLEEIRERVAAEKALRHSEAEFRKLAQQEALLNQLAKQIRTSLDLDTILETTVQQIRSLLQIDRCVFVWYREQGNKPGWEVVAEAKKPELTSILGHYRVEALNTLGQRLKNLEIVREDDLAMSNSFYLQQIYRDWGYTAILVLPIQAQSDDIGLLSCGHCSEPRPWSNTEVELLKSIIDQLAIAISQASLYSQSQAAARQAQERAEQLKQTLQQLQKTQAQLVQSEKMSSLGQMVAGVAHEINNPVSFIYGNLTPARQYIQDLLSLVQLYRESYPEPSIEIEDQIVACDLDFLIQDLPKLLSSMQAGADRIRSIVLSLRNFSRLHEADYKEVDLHEGIDNTLLILQHRLKKDDYSWKIQVIKEYGQLPDVECFVGQLNQVFMNILNNAIDALEMLCIDNSQLTLNNQPSKIPTIRIRTEEIDPEHVSIRISDNGPGMTEEVLQRIFDPFFTTKPVGSGTGLGLSISYQIVVDKHHGSLCCISAPGQGAEFIIELPVRQNSRHYS